MRPGLIDTGTRVGAVALLVLVVSPDRTTRPSIETVHINDNRTPAGILKRGTLTLHLEARVARWHPDAENGPGVDVPAFAERGRPARIPGPLIRVPAGTVVDVSLRNDVPNTVLAVRGLTSHAAGSAPDTSMLMVPFGETRQRHLRLDAPGTYYYWGTTTGRRFGARIHEDAQLTGAIVVDDSASVGAARDRIFVIGVMGDTTGGENLRAPRKQLLVVINGRSWPYTERITSTLGDSIHWRVVNASADPHPMHLHGTYYRVESRGDGLLDQRLSPDRTDLVNTEFLPPGTTMTMSWSPEHEGNWLFHCHIPEHFEHRGPLGSVPLATSSGVHRTMNHALEGMGGLVLGVTVRLKKRPPSAPEPARRRLRLLVRENIGSAAGLPWYGFALHENGAEPALDSGFRSGPPIVLVRGQPVGITVVNRTQVPTAVHWHGIELESYFDGVAGFSGSAARLAPVVAPADSFEARFTPPRSGTFMYHTHVDEIRQQRAGLAGMLLVLDSGARFDPEHDIPILISSPRDSMEERNGVLINGRLDPVPLAMYRGVAYRLRFGNLTTARPGLRVDLLRDTILQSWTPIAKDGADLPEPRRIPRPARQRISIGETADFELIPTVAGAMRIELRTTGGALLGTLRMNVQ